MANGTRNVDTFMQIFGEDLDFHKDHSLRFKIMEKEKKKKKLITTFHINVALVLPSKYAAIS